MKKNIYDKIEKISILRRKLTALELDVQKELDNVGEFLKSKKYENKNKTYKPKMLKRDIICNYTGCTKIFLKGTNSTQVASHVRMNHKNPKNKETFKETEGFNNIASDMGY